MRLEVAAALALRRRARSASSGPARAPPPPPFGLAPRYARALTPARFRTLPLVSLLGVLDRPSWAANADVGAARAYMDALATPRDLFMLLTAARAAAAPRPDGTTFSWSPRAASTSAPAIGHLLRGAAEVFSLIFGARGLPAVHRAVDATDKRLLHPDILSRFEAAATASRSGEGAAGRAAIAPSALEVRSAKVVDFYGVWDCSLTDEDLLGADVSVREIGHSCNVEPSSVVAAGDDSDAGASGAGSAGAGGWLRRLSHTFLHYYGLKLPRQVFTQVTVAFLCERMASPAPSAAIPAPSAAVSSATASAAGSAADADAAVAAEAEAAVVAEAETAALLSLAPPDSPLAVLLLRRARGAPPPVVEVHTLTFEGHALVAAPAPGSLRARLPLLRFLWPDRLLLAPGGGWRVVCVDGHMSVGLGAGAGGAGPGHASLSFTRGNAVAKARDLGWRRARLEMAEAIDTHAEDAAAYAEVAAVAVRAARDVRALAACFAPPPAAPAVGAAAPAAAPALHAVWSAFPSSRFGGRPLAEVEAALTPLLEHLTAAARDLADAQSTPPWRKRLEAEQREEREAEAAEAAAAAAASSAAAAAPAAAADAAAAASASATASATVTAARLHRELDRASAAHGDEDEPSPSSADRPGRSSDLVRGHIEALTRFTRLVSSHTWAVTAYAAIRARVGKTMGELPGRRMDAEILYQFGARGALSLLSATLEALAPFAPPEVGPAAPAADDEGSDSDSSDDESEGAEAVAALRAAERADFGRRLRRLRARCERVAELELGAPTASGPNASGGGDVRRRAVGGGVGGLGSGAAEASGDGDEAAAAAPPSSSALRARFGAALHAAYGLTSGLIGDMADAGLLSAAALAAVQQGQQPQDKCTSAPAGERRAGE